ncbi:MAG TPA: DUF885 domain-containing protein [Sporichthyaceae bacterium]|jgi:uncharacterized protein (DUF885 family)|nr:DUF885 domain-containing protein [Sporichthyaceae bacterium]
MIPPADATQFRQLAGEVVDDYLAADPVAATALGDHRHDDRLPEPGAAAREREAGRWSARLAELDAVDVATLEVDEQVDHAILRHRVDARVFGLCELREAEWNPLVGNPGTAIHLLLARDFAPLEVRLRALGARLAAIPESLAVARAGLGDLPEVHVQTAIGQFTGTRTLLATEVDRALHRAQALRREVEPALDAAITALDQHIDWLTERQDDAAGDPRLGPELFAGKLRLTLDTDDSPDDVLGAAEAELERVGELIAEAASRVAGSAPRPGQVREVLDSLAAQAPDDASIVALAEQSLAETTAFVAEHDLVTIFDDPVEIVVMPEIHRGVAVAYCDPPGPLETAPLPTFYAISPTPADWPPERVTSFFREYNVHMVRNLTIHEAMPGHVLQLAHDRRQHTTTRVRSTFWSGPFVEGWAVYAEELMAGHGFGGDAVRMQQLKMALRMTINAILDVRVHTRGMTREEAMRLMIDRGHQEEGEAVGKWRRALLTSTQLSTYFVGWLGVRGIVRELTTSRPAASAREVHDAVLAHGSPPPRHLRRLLSLPVPRP